MAQPTLLLYRFTEDEQRRARILVRKLPFLRLMIVPPADEGKKLSALLSGDKGKPLPLSGAVSAPMAVFADCPGPLLSSLLDLPKQISSRHILRALLTETNREWTGAELFRNLREEDTRLSGRG